MLILLISLIIYLKKRKQNITNSIITFNKKTNEFQFKQKKISFEDNEKKVLFFLLENSNTYVSLNTLNELFENAKQVESQSAIIKRREQAVSSLISKVSLITEIPESELVFERKNSEDKRLKDVLLLPNLLKEI